LKPTVFINENDECLYNYGTEYHKPYFDHISKLDIGIAKVDKNKSGICHHMMFENAYITEIINKVEEKHNNKFYNVFLKLVTDTRESGASEYEIYFNYILQNHCDKIKIRELQWMNSNSISHLNSGFDYISCHWYMR
jgi:hypothetical protein